MVDLRFEMPCLIPFAVTRSGDLASIANDVQQLTRCPHPFAE
jgi:hypothetical protein